MGVVSGVNTVTDGLIFYVDPTNTNTYSGVGTTAYNLIPGGINNFSLNNGLSYDLDKSELQKILDDKRCLQTIR